MAKTTQRNRKQLLPQTERSLPFALIRAREKVMSPIRDMLSDCDITEQQWRVLRVLSQYGPQDATLVAERAVILLPSLTRIVQSMYQKGYVSRTANEQDRRRQIIAITQTGQKLIDDHLDQATALAARFEEVVGPKDFERLLEILGRLERL